MFSFQPTSFIPSSLIHSTLIYLNQFLYCSHILSQASSLFSLWVGPREKRQLACGVWAQAEPSQQSRSDWREERAGLQPIMKEKTKEKQTNHQLIAGFPRPAAINGCWVVCSLTAGHWAPWGGARFLHFADATNSKNSISLHSFHCLACRSIADSSLTNQSPTAHPLNLISLIIKEKSWVGAA